MHVALSADPAPPIYTPLPVPECVREVIAMLPPGTATSAAPIEDHCHSLLPCELAAIVRAIPLRRREFATGRVCARRALLLLGSLPQPIAVGDRREPIWPIGYTGSITHDLGLCVAVARRKDSVDTLGIDIADAAPLSEEGMRLVCTVEERARFPDAPSLAAAASKVVFSAKESLFKAIFPLVGRYVDFQEVIVTPDARRRTWRAAPSAENADLQSILENIEGRLALGAGAVITAAWHCRSSADAARGHGHW